MKTLLSLALLAIASCAPAPSWTAFNPLDEPGESQPTAAELHAKNLANITGNPSTLYLP